MDMKPIARIAVCTLIFLAAGSAQAQFKEEAEPGGIKLGQTKTMKWQAGMTAAAAGPCRAIHGYIPVPTDWPEQEVSVVKEEISPGVRVSYRTVQGGVKVMDIRAGYLPPGRDMRAVVTFEVRRRAILPPEKTDDFVLPNLKKLPGSVKIYLRPSPLIESRDPKIRKLAKELVGKEERAWDKVKAIYDWVRDHVKYQNGPLKGALAALKDGTGDCEEIASLFIALCRAADIPARTVWIPGQTEKMDHCYMEFYLEDKKGAGHWFPCQSAGKEEFGGISERRPILQKGDSFIPLQGERKPQRYLAERITVQMQNPGDFRPRWVRKLVP
jgi:hypothetical protein